MTTYVWRDGWVDKQTGERMEVPDRICVPTVRSDIPEYASPIDGRLISGRAQQREDLKRNDCVLAPPAKKFDREEYVERKARQAKMIEDRKLNV
jgi:hypothetical protein